MVINCNARRSLDRPEPLGECQVFNRHLEG